MALKKIHDNIFKAFTNWLTTSPISFGVASLEIKLN
jgi:hypothetical protein